MSSLRLTDLNTVEICHDLFTFATKQEKQYKSQKNDKFTKQNGEPAVDQLAQSAQKSKYWHLIKESKFLDASKIKICQEKEFIWDSNREQQLWYKNLVIPTIKVNGKISQKESKIFAKMRCFKQLENQSFHEVELTGELEQEFNDDKPLFFSGIKFLETTFISRSICFYLVLTIEKSQSKELQKQSEILASYVSDSIYVEARKKSKRLRSERFTSNYLDTLTSKNQSTQKLNQDVKSEYFVSEIKELYELNSYLNQLNNENEEKISPFILCQLFPSIIRVYINKKIYADCKELINDSIVQTQKILNNDPAYFLQKNVCNQNESDCVIYLQVSKSSKNQLLPTVQQIQQKLLRFKPQALQCIFEKSSYLQQKYRQINSSLEIAELIENNYQIFNKHSTKPFKFSKAQKRITKIDDFLNQLEENRSKVQYSYKEFIKQEKQIFCKYTTTINLSDFPPFEPLLTKKVKAIANKMQFKKLGTQSLIEIEEKEVNKDFIFNNKQIETEKNISIQSTQITSFASPQTHMLQLDSIPLKISLSNEDLSTKLLSKESPKFSQDKLTNPILNISQSSIFDEIPLHNRDIFQNTQNSYQAIQENINSFAYMPLDIDFLEKQQNLIQQNNLNQSQQNYINQLQQNNINQIQQINYNMNFNNQQIIENQQSSFYLNQLSSYEQQKQFNYFNQPYIPNNLVSNLQQKQQQQIYFNKNQQKNYLNELNMQHIYHNQNSQYSINEQKKQQYFGNLIPQQQQFPHQLLLDRNQPVQNIYQDNLIKQQAGSISLIYI